MWNAKKILGGALDFHTCSMWVHKMCIISNIGLQSIHMARAHSPPRDINVEQQISLITVINVVNHT